MQNVMKAQCTDRHGEEKKKDQMELLKIHSHLDIKTLLNPTFTGHSFLFQDVIHFCFERNMCTNLDKLGPPQKSVVEKG